MLDLSRNRELGALWLVAWRLAVGPIFEGEALGFGTAVSE
jgi:hypothetical protein